jgi:hypothetical protein
MSSRTPQSIADHTVAEDLIRFDIEACGNDPAAHRAQWLRFVTGHSGRPPGADGVSRYAIVTARKHSKTTTICAFGSWLVSRGARVLMVGATPWQAEDLAVRVTRDGGSPADAVAVCGEVSGTYDAVLLDDVQAVDDGDTRGAEITAWIDGLGDHLAYGASVVAIGSIGRALGMYGEILAAPRWGVWTDPAIHDGKVLWPEMWSPSRLESYRAIDPVLFESAFMCGVVYEAGDDRP